MSRQFVAALATLIPAIAAAESPLDGTHGALVGLSTRRFERSLTLTQGGREQSENDGLWKAVGVWAGYRVAPLGDAEGDHLQLDVELGCEFMPHTGGVPLSAQLTSSWVWRFPHALWLGVGLRFGVSVDLPDVDYAHGHVSAPLSLGWSWLELQAGLGFTFPLAVDSRPVYGGALERGAAVALVPVDVSLVFRVF